MALITTPSTILKTYRYSETSKILRLLTRDQGLCSVIAKGARRPRSRFGGLLEPFTDGIATYYAKEGRELSTLSGFELRRERQALGRELLRYAGAGLLTEMALRFASSAPDRELFLQLRESLDRLVDEGGDVETAVLEEVWKLVWQLGFAPGVARCALCDRGPAPDRDAHFNLADGSIFCASCRHRVKQVDTRPVGAAEWAELASLLSGAGVRGRRLVTARFQRDLLRDFIAHHLTDGRPLNSFRFLDARLG